MEPVKGLGKGLAREVKGEQGRVGFIGSRREQYFKTQRPVCYIRRHYRSDEDEPKKVSIESDSMKTVGY